MSFPVNEVDLSLLLNCDQSSLLAEFKRWVEEKADFYGKSDEDFLVLYLRSCDFDLELSKKTLRLYYKARLRNPQWWKNRDINLPELQFLIKARAGCIFLDRHPNYPMVGVFHLARFGNDSTSVNPACKYITCGFEIASRRRNSQLNGGIAIFNFENLCWLAIMQIVWPPFLWDLLNSFLYCLPIKVHVVVLVNAPSIASTVVSILRSFLPEEHKHKIQCCKSWSGIGQFVPLEVLPDEYGGSAGPVKVHEDAAINEGLAMRDYFLNDDKYGYQA